jgi:hypothetical protein
MFLTKKLNVLVDHKETFLTKEEREWAKKHLEEIHYAIYYFILAGQPVIFFVTVQSVTFALASVCLWATANFAGLFFASADLRNSELLFFLLNLGLQFVNHRFLAVWSGFD